MSQATIREKEAFYKRTTSPTRVIGKCLVWKCDRVIVFIFYARRAAGKIQVQLGENTRINHCVNQCLQGEPVLAGALKTQSSRENQLLRYTVEPFCFQSPFDFLNK